jgi:hypothetical protein
MRRVLASASAVAFLIGALAGPTLASSANANNNACFGQARAEWLAANPPGALGDFASSQKSGNAVNAANWRDICQALP